MTLVATNPATGERIAEYPEMAPDALNDAIEATHDAFEQWRHRDITARAVDLRRLARALRMRRDECAALITAEMGKPIKAARDEIEKCASVCEYFARHGVDMLAPEEVRTDATGSFVTFNPLGVVLAVMPWNFPFWQVFRFAAPALMAGNACLLKHAANVQGCARRIEQLMAEAELPRHLFTTLPIGSARVDAVIEHPLVTAVTLTGSEEAGRAVARKAGECIKKTVLELGGSDAYIVLADADIRLAVEACVTSRLINSGQSCVAAKRFIVVEDILEEFEEAFVRRMESAVFGDPANEHTEVGPLARVDLRDKLHRQVQKSIEAGATCLLGGRIHEGPGAFYPPTVLTDVRSGMPAFDEETFGPVAALVPVEDEVAAIRVANDSRFGLGAAIFTRDIEHGEQLAAEEIQAGFVTVNDYVRSDPRLPFGGIKHSGYGRELSHFGIREFVNIKSVVVK